MTRAVAAIALVAGLAFGTLALRFLPSLDDDASYLSSVPTPSPSERPRLSERVVLIVIDGLRADTARELPELGRLRGLGIDATARAPFPTLSRPSLATILTGVEPRYSGVRTNHWSGALAVEALPADAMLATDHRNSERLFDLPWRSELPPAIGRHRFTLVIPAALDHAGHRHGGNSDEYRAIARELDAWLARLVATLDLARDTVIVTSDHGHSDGGGHGSLEPDVVTVPLVLAGAGIRPGAQLDDARLADLAPTIAALLGLEAPRHALGRTLGEALISATSYRDADRERHAGLAPYLAEIDRIVEDRRRSARRVRIPIALGALAIALALILRARSRFDRRAFAALAFPAALLAALATLDLGMSPIHVAGDSLSLVLELAGYLGIATGVHVVAVFATNRAVAIHALGLFVVATWALAAWSLVGEPGAATLESPEHVMVTPIAMLAAAWYALVAIPAGAIASMLRAWWIR